MTNSFTTLSSVPANFKNPDSLVIINGYAVSFKEKYKDLLQRPYGGYHSGDAKLEGLILNVYCGSIDLRSGKFAGEVNMASFEIKIDHVDEIRRSDGTLVWKNTDTDYCP